MSFCSRFLVLLLPVNGTDHAADIYALNDALDALAKQEPHRAKVIELRYFGGLSVEETAEALGVSGVRLRFCQEALDQESRDLCVTGIGRPRTRRLGKVVAVSAW